MNITIENPPSHGRTLLRRAGYAQHVGRNQSISFVRRFSRDNYPRFHIYINNEIPGKQIELSLHLDEKKPSYEGVRAHSGQYDGSLVEEEAQRLITFFKT